jgi:PII-like signaling protein
MQIPMDAVLLRIHASERDRFEHQPFHEAVVMKAREAGLKGATVLRGVIGYGHDSRIHTAKILDLSIDLPLVIEIIDDEANINAFLPTLDGMMEFGLVTLEKVRVIRYGAPKDAA